ncbi:MAG: hypothetical protein AVDCRST_MAG88-2505, partial [uncultured Thermomicrobiales bacterium]
GTWWDCPPNRARDGHETSDERGGRGGRRADRRGDHPPDRPAPRDRAHRHRLPLVHPDAVEDAAELRVPPERAGRPLRLGRPGDREPQVLVVSLLSRQRRPAEHRPLRLVRLRRRANHGDPARLRAADPARRPARFRAGNQPPDRAVGGAARVVLDLRHARAPQPHPRPDRGRALARRRRDPPPARRGGGCPRQLARPHRRGAHV